MKKFLLLAYFLIFIPSFTISGDTDNTCKMNENGVCSTYTPISEKDESKCIHSEDYQSCQLKNCSQLDSSHCYLYETFKQKICMKNENGNGCKLFSCSDMDPKECDRFYLPNSEYQCIKIDNSCQLKKCSELKPPNCEKYYPYNYNQKCIASGNECVLKECSDFKKANCGNFIPRDSYYKCASDPKVEGNCTLIPKECQELEYSHCQRFPSYEGKNGEIFECVGKSDKSGCEIKSCKGQSKDKCGDFIPYSEDQKCMLNSKTNECEIVSCNEYNPNKCEEFIPNKKSKKCIKNENSEPVSCTMEFKRCDEFKNGECINYYPWSGLSSEDESCMDGEKNKCSLTSCESFSTNQCQNFKSNEEYEQCINTGKSCQLVQCEDLSSNQCNKFLTENLNFKCISKDNGCIPEEKECSELPIMYCKEEEYKMKKDNKICVLNDKGDKCKVKGTTEGSQKIRLELLTIFIFALLF